MDHHQPHWIDKENEKKLLWKVHSKPEIGPIGTSLSLCLLLSIEHLLCARHAIVCVCVYIYIHIYICIYIYVCIYMYIYMYVYICICMYVYIHTVSFGIYIVLFKPFIIHLLEMGTVFALIFKWENWGSVRLNKVTDSTQVVNAKLVSQKKKKKKLVSH